MKKMKMVGALACAAIAQCQMIVAQPVVPEVVDIEFPTYGFSDPDPVPHPGTALYPYFRFDGSSAVAEMRKWKAVILENEKIRVTMLPEIGGKVWGAEDKASGHAFVYYNHAVKFRNIALRGPWCSGGIELNFGITGHAPTSSTPVDWCVRTNADGSASYFASATEYINRTTWQVEVRLAPGEDHFTMRTVWHNGSNLPGPYYHWMNAAFPLTGNAQLVFPGRNYIGHPGDAHAWPVDAQGRDLSIYANNAFGSHKSYHVINGDNRIFGVWWPERSIGAVHRNPVYDKYGRKVWLWALSRSGGIWEDLLTDSDGQYAELQSGRAFQQPSGSCVDTPFKIPPFTPGCTDFFEESWGVVHSRDAFGKPEAGAKPRPTEMPKNFDWNSAQGLFARGVQMLRTRHADGDAKLLLEASLAADPNFAPAINALSGLANRQARYCEAAALAERALAVDTYDAEANYLAGFAAFAQRDNATAKERLGLASYSPAVRSAAYSLLARIALREHDWSEAAKLAERALSANSLSLDALHVRIVAKRKAGDANGAARFAREALDRLPLFHAARAELGWCGGGEDYREMLKGEFPHETSIDLASWYEESGLVDEARELLSHAPKHPIAAIRRAYLDRDAAALGRVTAMPVAFAFPFRRETLPALEWAAKESGSWKFRYYLAMFKAANGDQDGADALLDSCGGEPDEATFYMFRAGRKIGEAKLADVVEAERRGGGWRASLMKSAHFSAKGDYAAALDAVERIHAQYPNVTSVKLAYAKALLDAGRAADCVAYLEKSTILPAEVGDNAGDIWRDACRALGDDAKAESWPENLGAGKPYLQDNRPYEFKRAKRDRDEVPPLVDFEDGAPWRAEASDAAAHCSATSEDQLFGRYTLRVSYSGRGKAPSVTVAPQTPFALPSRFDTFSVWVKGNHWGRGANSDHSIPSPALSALFRTGAGKEVRIQLGKVDWPDWHLVDHRFTKAERDSIEGGAFVGFAFTGGTQTQFLQMHFDNVAVFEDDLTRPIAVRPRARRPIKPLPGADQGINTGKGTLPFPTREETIIPVTGEPGPGDIAPQFNGGAVKGDDISKLKVSTFRMGKSLVVDFSAPAGAVTALSAGTASEAKVLKSFTVPYLTYGDGEARLKIDLLEGGWYRSAVFDWYRSNASELAAVGGTQAMLYHPKTDGSHNPVSERLVITVSRDFAEVLPEIPNPESPHKAVTGTRAWRSHGSFNRDFDRAFWREVKRAGIDHVVVTDHETLWRDRGESFTFRTEAAPGRGGDAAEMAYSRFMRGALGYVYGPYNNYTDFSPMNAHWSRDIVSRRRDGSFGTAWVRCYAPKAALAPGFCEEIAPKVQAKFAFDTAYCDVHTAIPPWNRTDYDSRIPGAATFAQTFYAYGELLLLQRKAWNGPVYSEGGQHFFYAGLADGNYAQDQGYNFRTKPWIVDFDLLKIHPKECNFGMGSLLMFTPSKDPKRRCYHLPAAVTEKEHAEMLDLFFTATVAFGHAPYLVLDYCFDPMKPFGLAYGPKAAVDMAKGMPIALRSYAMVQPIAARYTQEDVARISYFGADGRARTSSEAIADGSVERSQLAVEYAGGTFVVANGNQGEWLRTTVGGKTIALPPRAFAAWTADGKVRAEITEDAAGVRHYFSDCPEFTYRDGAFVRKAGGGK